jgi:hypothetical protein
MSSVTEDRNESRPAEVLRSEAATAVRAEMQLRNSSYCELRRIRCKFHEGVFTLRGILPSYYLKQIAQTIVYKTDKGSIIVNHIEVVDPTAQPKRSPSRPGTWDASAEIPASNSFRRIVSFKERP